MTNDDWEPFKEMLADVFTYYGKTLSAGLIEIYWHGLRMYDLPAIRDALGRHAKNTEQGRFLPKLADIELMLGGSTLDAANAALSKLEEAMKRFGSSYTLVFDDALIHRVVDEMGGWIELGKITTKDWTFRRAEFLTRYRGYWARKECPSYRPKMVGLWDAENGDRWIGHPGFRPDENLRLVGAPEECRRVLLGGVDNPLVTITAGAAAALALAAPAAALEKR